MNMKFIRLWLLVVCLAMGSQATSVGESTLKWDFIELDDSYKFTLSGIPRRRNGIYTVLYTATLYQKLRGGELVHILSQDDDGEDITFEIPTHRFKEIDRMVKAKIEYTNGFMMKSKTFDLRLEKTVGDSDATLEDLEWENSLSVDLNDNWEIQLKDVPSRDHRRYWVTLYQKLEGDNWMKLQECGEFKHPPKKNTITLTVPGSKFLGDSKIVMAEVTYPDDSKLESKNLDLQQLFERETATMVPVGLIVGCVVGGVCLIAFVVGCILYQKRRRPRVPLEQPVRVMG